MNQLALSQIQISSQRFDVIIHAEDFFQIRTIDNFFRPKSQKKRSLGLMRGTAQCNAMHIQPLVVFRTLDVRSSNCTRRLDRSFCLHLHPFAFRAPLPLFFFVPRAAEEIKRKDDIFLASDNQRQS